MNKNVLTIEEYQKTTTFFFRKELNYIIIFIYFFLSLIFIFFIWAFFFKIDILVKTRGIIRPTNTISNIVNLYEGRLEKVNYFNGKNVFKGELLYSIDAQLYEITLEKDSSLLKKNKVKIRNLKELFKSVKNNKSMFTNTDNRCYYEYSNYFNKRSRENTILNVTKLEYSKYKKLGHNTNYVSEMELAKYKQKYMQSLYAYKVLKTELLTVVTEKLDFLVETNLNLEEEIKILKNKIENDKYYSSISGVIQCENTLNKGDYISVGTNMFKIVPKNTKYKVDILIPNKHISKTKKNQIINYRIDSLPYKEYGILTGRVKKISADTSQDSNYLVEGSLDKIYLKNKSGSTEKIKIGMTSDIRIISGKKTILKIILEKLNFINKE